MVPYIFDINHGRLPVLYALPALSRPIFDASYPALVRRMPRKSNSLAMTQAHTRQMELGGGTVS